MFWYEALQFLNNCNIKNKKQFFKTHFIDA